MRTRRRQLLWIGGLVALTATPVFAWTAVEVSGRVTDLTGTPVEGAMVRARAEGSEVDSVRTDANGEFALACSPPLVLEVAHPDFQSQSFEVGSVSDEPVEVALSRREEVVREEIAVSASRSQGNFSAQSISASVLTPEGLTELPNAVGEIVAEVPGVSQNGQGGLFQTYSVRGVSRQRVLTLVEGMRIVGERRAGVSASFLDPLLLGSVEVVRGPSSTYWGSGALGGVVQLFPRRFTGPSVTVGYSTEGDERSVSAGQGDESAGGAWSWGVAAREAGLGETAGGEVLFSGFEQVSASFRRSWKGERMDWEALVLASSGNDIGKANTDFPDRTTTYPDEGHLLMHLAASRDDGWRFEAWAHPNDLETRVETLAEGTEGTEGAEGVDRVENRALDWGLDAQYEVRRGPNRTLRWGVDLFARDGVTAREESRDPAGAVLLEQETLSGASEREFGLYGAIETMLGAKDSGRSRIDGVTLLAGGRLAYQRQKNAGFESFDDTAITAFIGAVVPLSKGLELTANLGTGLRFPSISERFFTGTTGRGFVTGNPALEPEGSLAADVGLRWVGESLFLTASVFRTEIDDYIERVEFEPGQLTFVNLASGRVRGLELDGGWRLAPDWDLTFGGHLIEGEADDGTVLADIPPQSVFAGWSFERERWRWRGRVEKRFMKDDFGSGEKPIPDAGLLSTSLGWQWRPDLGLRLAGRNLLDEEYFNSADRRVPPAAGRSLSLSVEWRR